MESSRLGTGTFPAKVHGRFLETGHNRKKGDPSTSGKFEFGVHRKSEEVPLLVPIMRKITDQHLAPTNHATHWPTYTLLGCLNV